MIDINIDTLLSTIEEQSIRTDASANGLIKSVLFYRKSLYVWRKELQIILPKPEDLNLAGYKQLLMSTTVSIQKASALYSTANSLYNLLSETAKAKRAELSDILIEEHLSGNGKVMSKAKLDDLTSRPLRGITDIISISRVIRDFFKEERDTLIEVRKLLEQLGYVLHTERKIDGDL